MVLVMRSDGALERSVPQASFIRTYADGVGHDSVPDGLRLSEERGTGGGLDVGGDAEPLFVARAQRTPDAILLAAIDETALRYGAHPGLRRAGLSVTDWRRVFRANIEIESAYDPRALSPVGAYGLGQLMPATAAELGVDRADWRQNLDGSARYLLEMMERFADVRLGLAAYNAGPDAVLRHGGIPPYPETRAHVGRVLAVVRRLQGETS